MPDSNGFSADVSLRILCVGCGTDSNRYDAILYNLKKVKVIHPINQISDHLLKYDPFVHCRLINQQAMERQYDKVRRTDRQETDPAFLHNLLDNSVSCTVAVPTQEYPLVQATFFAFDKLTDEVIFHFSKYGFSGQEILTGKPITISVYKYGKLYTAERAVDFGGEYQSVIIYGKIRIVDEETEKMQAMQFFFDRYFSQIPASDYKAFTVTEANPIHVVKVKIDKWIGKQHLLPPAAIQSFYPESSPVIV